MPANAARHELAAPGAVAEIRRCGSWEDLPVVPADIHDFFAASVGAGAALIGLLFVAISVSAERLAKAEASSQLLRIRANAALTAFINALVISLFALLPSEVIGTTAMVVAILGLLFVTAALLSLVRLRRVRNVTRADGLFLIGLVIVFGYQLVAGYDVNHRPGDSGAVGTIAILVIVCFLIEISRVWELIGGPSIGIAREVAAMMRDTRGNPAGLTVPSRGMYSGVARTAVASARYHSESPGWRSYQFP